MKLLKEINDHDVGFGPKESFEKRYQIRKAGRAVLFNGDKISLQYVAKHKFHKLPGGGIEAGESIQEGLKREVQEEAGCDINIGDPIGMIIEYRDKFDQIQISYCYFGQVEGDIGESVYDEGEVEENFRPMWVTLDEAIDLIEKDDTDDYQGKFIRIRDLTLLKEAKRLLRE